MLGAHINNDIDFCARGVKAKLKIGLVRRLISKRKGHLSSILLKNYLVVLKIKLCIIILKIIFRN